jgi:hypothetical protein
VTFFPARVAICVVAKPLAALGTLFLDHRASKASKKSRYQKKYDQKKLKRILFNKDTSSHTCHTKPPRLPP